MAGNSDIDYVFIVYEKDGDNTQCTLKKNIISDSFPFPLANTKTKV